MKTTNLSYPELVTSAKQSTRDFINCRQWHDLCQYLRSWLHANCPLYPQDEIEITIGSWVSRQIIVQDQIEARGGLGSACASPRTGEIIDPKEKIKGKEGGFFTTWNYTAEAELSHELDGFWDNLLPTYERKIKAQEEYPCAETKVDEVLARIARNKEKRK